MLSSWVKLHYLRLRQDKLIFNPKHNDVLPVENLGLYGLGDTQEDYITTQDDVSLHLWRYTSENEQAPTFVFFHGNTGNWVDVGRPNKGETYDRFYRLELFREIIDNDANFIAVSMRGYGKSQNKPPSEQAFELDLNAVANYLQQENIPHDKIICAGESLGGAIAYMMAECLTKRQMPPKMLIAISAFASMVERVAQEHPKINRGKVELYLRHHFDSLKRTQTLDKNTNIYLFHGKDDEATHHYHSNLLLQEAINHGLNSRYDLMDNVGHINWDARRIIEKTIAFYNDC